MSENGIENAKVGYGHPPVEHQFSSENQPSPEAKSEGVREHWNRKKFAQAIMDRVDRYANLTLDELKTVQANKENLSMLDRLAMEYILAAGTGDKQMMVDILDRHVSKAPTTMQLGDEDNPITKIVVEVVNSNPTHPNDTEATSDKRVPASEGSGSDGQVPNIPA